MMTLLAGIATSVLALFSVYLINTKLPDVNVMGWYLNFVIPAGALLVGGIAGSGYGFGSWMSGARITRGMLAGILALQLAVYVGAQYVEFKTLDLRYEDSGEPVPFTTYVDFTTRSFAFSDRGKPGKPLGAWGYAFRALEALGFAAGGLIGAAALYGRAYCDRCKVYMRKKHLGLVPAGTEFKKIGKKDEAAQAAYLKENEDLFEAARKDVDAALGHGVAGRARELQDALGKHDSKAAAKRNSRFGMDLWHCPRCSDGFLEVQLYQGFGNEMTTTQIARAEVKPEVVDAVLLGRATA